MAVEDMQRLLRERIGIISEAELAEVLGISEKSLWRRRRDSAGPPCITIERRHFYRLDDVKAWLDSLANSGHFVNASISAEIDELIHGAS